MIEGILKSSSRDSSTIYLSRDWLNSLILQTFGAYLSDGLRPCSHFYGTGECFLWRASRLPALHMPLASSGESVAAAVAALPPPPSEDTSQLLRVTTIASRRPSTVQAQGRNSSTSTATSGSDTPEMIRFKAFPYSGINDYMIFCQQEYLSLGGG